MKKLISFLLAGSCFGATWTIDAGSTRIGNTRYTQAGPITVTTSGAPVAAQRSFIYVDVPGNLNISLPPGVTGSCSGGPCQIFTTDSAKGATQFGSGSARPTTVNDGLYWIDPVFNTTATTTGATSLLANAPAPLPGNQDGFATGTGQTAGIRFQSSQAGYLVSVRFYKQAQDTSTSLVVNLSNDSGGLLGTTTINYSAGATGWQTASFSSALALTANTYYQLWAVMQTGGGYAYRNGFFRNYRIANGPLSSASYYIGTNLSCDSSDSFPKTSDARSSGSAQFTSVAIIGCVDIQASGSATVVSPGFGEGSGRLGYSQWNLVEGAQVMQGGKGPGPYAVVNTVISNSGNQWHHDSAGGYRRRADYWYYRDIFQWPATTRTGSTGGDGFQYISRQLLEWKSGVRIHVEGTIFQSAWNDGQGSSLMAVFGNRDGGTHDVWVGNNEFRHGPGVTSLGGQYEEGAPPVRNYFGNNLVWDIASYVSSAQAQDGQAWLVEGGGPSEDFILDHNTVHPLRGNLNALFWTFPGDQREGLQITNNIFPIDTTSRGIGQDSNWCGAVATGEAITGPNCARWGNFQMTNNVLYPSVWSFTEKQMAGCPGSANVTCTPSSNQTQAGVQAAYPTLKNSNYIPGNTNVTQYGWRNNGVFNSNSDTFASGSRDFRLKPSSLFASAGAYRTTDARDIGADVQAVYDAEGRVDLKGVPNRSITQTSATVVFRAPDSQACSVDYRIHDGADPNLISGFLRAADSGFQKGTRNVALTGLTAGKAYDYRVNCSSFQPMGTFHTKN